MSELSDVERDAVQVVRVLSTLSYWPACQEADPYEDEIRRVLAAEGGAAAGRILAYLRQLRGAGDGEATAYPARLGPWRDWCPPRGNVFGTPAPRRPWDATGGVGHGDPGAVGHGDPGE